MVKADTAEEEAEEDVGEDGTEAKPLKGTKSSKAVKHDSAQEEEEGKEDKAAADEKKDEELPQKADSQHGKKQTVKGKKEKKGDATGPSATPKAGKRAKKS